MVPILSILSCVTVSLYYTCHIVKRNICVQRKGMQTETTVSTNGCVCFRFFGLRCTIHERLCIVVHIECLPNFVIFIIALIDKLNMRKQNWNNFQFSLNDFQIRMVFVCCFGAPLVLCISYSWTISCALFINPFPFNNRSFIWTTNNHTHI